MNDFSIAHVIRCIADKFVVSHDLCVNGVTNTHWAATHTDGVPAVKFAIAFSAKNHDRNIECERDLHVIITQRHNVYVSCMEGTRVRSEPELDKWINVGNHDSCWPESVASAVRDALCEIHTVCFKDENGYQVPLNSMHVHSYFKGWYFGDAPFSFVRVFSELRTDDNGSNISHERLITKITPMKVELHLKDAT